MVDLPVWRMGEFLRIVFQYLWGRPDGATTREILNYISLRTELTRNEVNPFPSAPDFRNYEILVGAAMAAATKAGWLAREKSKWFFTDEGRLICKDFGSVEAFYAESQRIFEEWRLQRSAARLTVEAAEEKAWDQIQQYLLGLSHQEFRYLINDLLEALDYHIIWVAPPEKKRGHIDIIACTDPLGMVKPRVIVQVKQKGQLITAEELKVSFSFLGTNDVGLVVSPGGFTKDAKEFALTQPTQGISLMDLPKFFDLWVEYYEKLSHTARQHFPLRAVHFLSVEGT
jgi:restriction system protein